jgi:hypothetical protein
VSKAATIKVTIVRGVEGNAVYINDYRIAGPKPWGGGPIAYEWLVSQTDMAMALKRPCVAGSTPRKKEVMKKRALPRAGETWIDRDQLEVSVDRVRASRVTYTENIMLIVHDVAVTTFMKAYKKKEVPSEV